MAQFLLFSGKISAKVFLIPLCLGFAILWNGCKELDEEPPWVEPPDRPMMLFTDTTLLDFYEKKVLSWKLKTAYLERWAGSEKVFAKPIIVDIFDSLGDKVAFLRADSGTLDTRMNFVFAYGHVYALTPKGASVRADSLLWHKTDNLVKTESYVRVVSENGDVLQGQGFESDARMDHWRILSNVTGIFQDAAKRLKEEDEKENETQLASSSSVALSSSSSLKLQPKPQPQKIPDQKRKSAKKYTAPPLLPTKHPLPSQNKTTGGSP